MRIHPLLLLVVIGVKSKGLFDFKTDTLDNFNGGRRLLASGSLRTLTDILRQLKFPIPKVGPASNMYKLKWSAKLEHKAFVYGENKSSFPDLEFQSFKYDGLVGFQWPGVLGEVISKILGPLLPHKVFRDILDSFINILESLLMAIILAVNYPKDLPVADDVNLGATEALFAHRYEIGCYTKIVYSICFMEPSRNGGYLYHFGVPCSNCSTHCEFFEDDNGFIEEGDLCVPPETESNATAALEVKQERIESNGSFCSVFPLMLIALISTCLQKFY
ncbi:hypothetical protein B9Z55_012016 [Caenorhabditis nigoni]|uniref:Uncharacterized protein n=1 Tax=Caenorhabditis nigoni TaxID=1611254 RepID=A0A2G5TVD7_9PELO|nr:hypothetical protein B9Z55_012016 [Caenorhabditis nigoni]